MPRRVEVRRCPDGSVQLVIDGKPIPKPQSFRWHGFTVLAEMDPAIKELSGRDVFHLSVSVSTEARKPTDEEVQEVVDEWVPKAMELLERPSVINPFVRHFFDRNAL